MDYLEIDGKNLRVECNFNAICDFMEKRGLKDLDFLNGSMGLQDWLVMMIASIKEGERMEGREASFSLLDLGARPVNDISKLLGKFIEIFAKQNASSSDSKKK